MWSNSVKPMVAAALRLLGHFWLEEVKPADLATIAALIGGGGFGVFVFQGIGQTAMDLVLLGTVPTVLLGFAAAITLDALIDSNLLSAGGRQKA